MKHDNTIYLPDFIIVLKELSMKDGLDMSKLFFKTAMTYGLLHKIKKELLARELIFVKREGVRDKISFTEKGKTFISHVNKMLDILEIPYSELHSYRRRAGKNSPKNSEE